MSGLPVVSGKERVKILGKIESHYQAGWIVC